MFTYKDLYIEDGKKVLEVNLFTDKHCNFDCIFCPIPRPIGSDHQVPDDKDNQASLQELDRLLAETPAELIFINSQGESLLHPLIGNIIKVIKTHGLRVRLLSNGYLLNDTKYKTYAESCDEIIGEIKTAYNADFQKLQRPGVDMSLDAYVENMALFNQSYQGKFILEVTLIRGYNDTDEAIEKMSIMIGTIKPNVLLVVTLDGVFRQKLGVSDEKLSSIAQVLHGAIN